MPNAEADLVLQAIKGDADAFEELVRRYQRLVFNIVYHYLGRGAEVEDLAQEVFLKFYRSLERYDRTRPLKHWIGKIAVNRCLDEIRRRKNPRVKSLADLSEQDSGRLERIFEISGQRHLTEEEAEQCLQYLQQAMACLSDKDRAAFVLRELEDMDYAEVAGVLSSSEVAVRIRVSRARKRLQEELERMLYEGQI
jgi:RNA polymerase sigma-70 factor (ECF subfamily)